MINKKQKQVQVLHDILKQPKQGIQISNITPTNQKNKKGVSQKDIKYNIEGRLIHIKMGTQKEPKDSQQITKMEQRMVQFLQNNGIENCLVFVTGHDIKIQVF